MLVEEIPIAELHQDPANARKHGKRNLDSIKASLVQFGQQTPLVVDAKNVVRKGNGTMLAARDLGWAALKCVRTALSGVEATSYAIADNRTSELAEWDDLALARTLEAIRSEPDHPIEATGFSDDEVSALLETLGADALALGEESGPDGDRDGEADPDAAGDDPAAEPPGYAPVIRAELVFDSVEQQDRWYGFLRFLKGREEFDAETTCGRIDKFLLANEFTP